MADIDARLAAAGYEQHQTAEGLIIDILNEGDPRHLKAIPYLLYTYQPRLERIREHVPADLWNTLINYTRRITQDLGKHMELPETPAPLDLGFAAYAEEFAQQLRREEAMSPEQAHEQRTTSAALAKLFTNKEREILRKIKRNEALTKTEYEYFSRKTKKKLESILLLEERAKHLLTRKPKRQ